jgi:hypothetical protein
MLFAAAFIASRPVSVFTAAGFDTLDADGCEA